MNPDTQVVSPVYPCLKHRVRNSTSKSEDGVSYPPHFPYAGTAAKDPAAIVARTIATEFFMMKDRERMKVPELRKPENLRLMRSREQLKKNTGRF